MNFDQLKIFLIILEKVMFITLFQKSCLGLLFRYCLLASTNLSPYALKTGYFPKSSPHLSYAGDYGF